MQTILRFIFLATRRIKPLEANFNKLCALTNNDFCHIIVLLLPRPNLAKRLRGFLSQGKEATTTRAKGTLGGADAAMRQKDREDFGKV